MADSVVRAYVDLAAGRALVCARARLPQPASAPVHDEAARVVDFDPLCARQPQTNPIGTGVRPDDEVVLGLAARAVNDEIDPFIDV